MSTPASVVQDRTAVTPMALLAHGVPLSLLLDLALGPDSEDLLRQELRLPQQRPPDAAA